MTLADTLTLIDAALGAAALLAVLRLHVHVRELERRVDALCRGRE